jgi:hypothetical protein
MSMLWSFSPFIVFAVFTRYLPVTVALFSGGAVAAWLIVRDRMRHARSPKVLDLGTVILFFGLGVYVLGMGGDWSIFEVRLAVDGGLLAIALISMLIGQPFTLQYAREQVSPEVAAHPVFRTVNYQLTGVWALAFLVMTVADFIMARVSAVPLWVGIAMTIAALAGAMWFTRWYPMYRRSQVVNSQSKS